MNKHIKIARERKKAVPKNFIDITLFAVASKYVQHFQPVYQTPKDYFR